MFNNELFLLIFGKYMKQLLSIKEKALKIVKSVRGSTAAGINNSLLPRDCSCGEFAGWICRWCRPGKAFSLAFLAFAVSVSAVVLYEETSFWCLLDFR